MGKITDYPAVQQSRPQEVVSRTFYVLRNKTFYGFFTKMETKYTPLSAEKHTVNDATQYQTLASAVNAQASANRAVPECEYEIVMVSRSVTKGVLKSPAKTVRRIVQDGEPSVGHYWAIKNPFSDMDQSVPSMWDGKASIPAHAELSNAALFDSLDDLLVAAITHGTSFPKVAAGKYGRLVVRVVEEKTPEVRTEDVVTDVLTPLP